LLLLDGFDELNNKDIKIYDSLLKMFNKKTQELTILVTSCPHYAIYSEFLKCFGEHKVLNICPFGVEQRNLYINNFVKVFAQLKTNIKDLETFETPEDYITELE
jgi:peptidase E